MMQLFRRLMQILPGSIYFWLPITIIFLGYVFLGRLWQILIANSSPRLTLVTLTALFIGSIWALSLGLGGILATALAVGMVFYMGGLGFGIVATVVAGFIIWLGFQETDSDRQANKNLTWLDGGAVVVIMALALVSTLAVYQSLSGAIAAIIVGAIAGAYTVIGAQIKSTDITERQSLQFFAMIALTGLAIGWLHGVFTYQVFVPS